MPTNQGKILYAAKISFERFKAIEKWFWLYTIHMCPSEASTGDGEASSNQKTTGKCGKVLTPGENLLVFL